MAGTMSITFAESAVQDMGDDILFYYTDQAMPQVGSRLVEVKIC